MFVSETTTLTHRDATIESHVRAVERAITVMHERLAEPLTLHDLADAAYRSPFHFNRIFREVTGIPPTQFLYALRLQEAKRLLLTTDHLVTDICFDMCYSSLGTFTRRFTELVGVSPSQLRKLTCDGHALPGVLPQPESREQICSVTLHGTVEAPITHKPETIFVGLFSTPIPQGQPLACASLSELGSFALPQVSEGTYYAFALSSESAASPFEVLHTNKSIYLAANRQAVHVHKDMESRAINLTLRMAKPTDPPILTMVPFLGRTT